MHGLPVIAFPLCILSALSNWSGPARKPDPAQINSSIRFATQFGLMKCIVEFWSTIIGCPPWPGKSPLDALVLAQLSSNYCKMLYKLNPLAIRLLETISNASLCLNRKLERFDPN